MADKKTHLSIVLRTVDQATAKIQAINAKLDAATKPVRDFKKALGDLREKSGLSDVADGFRGVGGAVTDLLGKLAMVGGVVAGAVIGLKSIIDEFDALGDKAEEVGTSVDFLAQMRYAAIKTGGSVEQLDAGLRNFQKSLGQARAGTGRMATFLTKVYPPLLKQLKGTKSNEEALGLLADAMAKLEDPAKRAALAAATVGDPALATMLVKGSKGIQALRDEYAGMAGPQGEAVAASAEFGDSMDALKATTDGVKAALVTGLAPALKVIVDRMQKWLVAHRGDIAAWAKDIGERLPGAVRAVTEWIGRAYDRVSSFVASIGGLKTVALALGAALVGPLLSAIATLGTALLTNPIGLIVTGIATAALLIVKYWEPIKEFFVGLWDGVTGVFRAAWEFISDIVDKVADAVNTVISGAGRLGGMGAIRDVVEQEQSRDWVQGSISAAQGGDFTQQAIRAARLGVSSSEAKVTVDIANAPRGTRVTTDPKSTADVATKVGYQLLPGGP